MKTDSAIPGASSPSAAPLGTTTNPRPLPWLALAGWFVLCSAVAATGSVATTFGIRTWYAALTKPPLTPPNWIFAPVWTLLYAAMAVAAWLVWKTRESRCRTRGIRLFLVQLLLNLSWTWLFFGIRQPQLALVELALLGVAIALTMQAFFKMSQVAGWLLAPYLAWVAFAAYLDWGIWQLNR